VEMIATSIYKVTW